MNMKPILFNADMVRAILANRKTVTRRVVKPRPICYGSNSTLKPHTKDFFLSAEKNWLRCRVCGNDPEYSREGSDVAHHWIPPYRSGDILYVREAWTHTCIHCEYYPGTSFCCFDCGTCPEFVYKADGVSLDGWPDERWRLSILMPREAARIFLRVTKVYPQQLKDATEEDANAEGFRSRDEFISAILKMYPNSVEDNWFWVNEFERCEKPKEE